MKCVKPCPIGSNCSKNDGTVTSCKFRELYGEYIEDGKIICKKCE